MKRDPLSTCPQCKRGDCSLWARLRGLAFTDQELTRLLAKYHSDVCNFCRRPFPDDSLGACPACAHKRGKARARR